MKVLRWFLGGLTCGIIGEVCGWLFYGALFAKWTSQYQHLWRSINDPIWRIGMPLADILNGLMISLGFAILYRGIPGEGIKKGLMFGLTLWLITRLAGELFFYTMSPVSFMMVVVGWLHGIVFLLLGGLVIAAIYGRSLEE
ncbi:MAG: hypothetical protein AB1422_18975 [bacterium]